MPRHPQTGFVRFAIGFTLGFLPSSTLVLGLLVSVINLAIFIGVRFLAGKAYYQKTVELPVFADIARLIEAAI